jgi:hypothetical protein
VEWRTWIFLILVQGKGLGGRGGNELTLSAVLVDESGLERCSKGESQPSGYCDLNKGKQVATHGGRSHGALDARPCTHFEQLSVMEDEVVRQCLEFELERVPFQQTQSTFSSLCSI